MRTFFRGLIYVLVVLAFSPIIVPGIVVGILIGTFLASYKVGHQAAVWFLLAWTARKPEGLRMPAGVAFSNRHPRGRRH